MLLKVTNLWFVAHVVAAAAYKESKQCTQINARLVTCWGKIQMDGLTFDEKRGIFDIFHLF